MINARQSELLERQQQKILKVNFGRKTPYETCLLRSGLERLSDRRERLSRAFAFKTSCNPAFSHWFPESEPEENGHNLRRRARYKERFARTERLRNAPIYSFRRIVNVCDPPSPVFATVSCNFWYQKQEQILLKIMYWTLSQ